MPCIFFSVYCPQKHLLMKIMDMCEAERPREKMLDKGPSALSDGELLAILMRTGSKGESAIELAQRLLGMVDGSLSRLGCMTTVELSKVRGLGDSRASAVVAALELGRRFLLEESQVLKQPVLTSRMIFDLMLPLMKGLQQEENWIVYLNSNLYVIGKEKLTVGNGVSTVIDHRRIVKSALDRGASSLVMVHNHPAGNPHPSTADARETDSLRRSLNAVGLSLNDHVIVCDDRFYSFADDRLYRA